jgi:hypothetical protein
VVVLPLERLRPRQEDHEFQGSPGLIVIPYGRKEGREDGKEGREGGREREGGRRQGRRQEPGRQMLLPMVENQQC